MPLLLIVLVQIGLTIWLIHYLVSHDRGPKEPTTSLVAAGALGAGAVVIGIILEFILIPSKNLPDPTHPNVIVATSTILISCLIVGVVEELAKSGPLSLFLYKKGYFNEMTDGIIYFGIAGMIFGLLENIGYTLSFGLSTGLVRLITTPFMHAGFASIIGWSLARHKLLHTSRWAVVGGFGLAIGLHAFYDFGLFYGHAWSSLTSLVITIIVNTVLFVLYSRANGVDVSRGMSTVGRNRYCRHCGYPNPKNFLFCVNCGHRT